MLIGDARSPAMLRIRNFLSRNAQPHQVVEAESCAASASLLEQYGAGPADVLALCPNGSVLVNQRSAAVARLYRCRDLYQVLVLFGPARALLCPPQKRSSAWSFARSRWRCSPAC